jgi:hypothetical protein
MSEASFPVLESSQLHAISANIREIRYAPRDKLGPTSMKVALFLFSSLIGLAAGHYLFSGSSVFYASTLISYHLLLAGLILIPGIADWDYGSTSGMGAALSVFADSFRIRTGRESRELSLPIGEAILTHLACLALVIAIPYFRAHIPFFGLIRYGIAAVAFFEAQWLFSGGRKNQQSTEKPLPISGGTGEDNDAFLHYLAQPNRRFSQPGRSVGEEQAIWLADRMKKRAEIEEARRTAGLAPQSDKAQSA